MKESERKFTDLELGLAYSAIMHPIRFFKDYFFKYIKKGDLVVDVGCGEAPLFRDILTRVGKDGKICGIDFLRACLIVAKARLQDERVEYIRADGANLPLDSGVSDVTLCIEMIMQAPIFSDGADVEILKELKRITKTGGVIVVTFPSAKAYEYSMKMNIKSGVAPKEVIENSVEKKKGDCLTVKKVFPVTNRCYYKKWIVKRFKELGLEFEIKDYYLSRRMVQARYSKGVPLKMISKYLKMPNRYVVIARKK